MSRHAQENQSRAHRLSNSLLLKALLGIGLITTLLLVVSIVRGQSNAQPRRVQDLASNTHFMERFRKFGPHHIDIQKIVYFQDFIDGEPLKRENAITIVLSGVHNSGASYVVLKGGDADSLREWLAKNIKSYQDE